MIPIAKRYNTPHRHVVKTRMTEEEYADFTARLEHYDISQAEFIRQTITRATIRPIITVSPVNDELLAAVGKLTAEQYLTFEHDEFTMRPTLDENGRLVPREDYRIATLNCGGEDFNRGLWTGLGFSACIGAIIFSVLGLKAKPNDENEKE